jgi:plastocyanin
LLPGTARYPVHAMLGLITSDKVVIGVVVGIPLLVGAVIVVATRPGIARPVVAGASVVALLLVGVAIWAVFRSSPPTVAAGAQLASLPTAPVAPTSAPGTQSTQPSPPPAPCSPSGSTLQLVARGIAFDKDCLAAPAGTAFTIAFDNQDAGIPHNVDILSGPGGTHLGGANGPSDVITGVDQATYEVSALDPGTYYFQCDIHPNMHGTFVVA